MFPIADARKEGEVTDGFVTVAQFFHPADVVKAGVARARLEQAGIEARLSEENVASWLPHLMAATGGIKVLVREPDVPRALEILSEEFAPADAGEPVEEEIQDEDDDALTNIEATHEAALASSGDVACPECGSTDVVRKSFARTVTRVIVLAITVFLIVAVVIGALMPIALVIPAVVIPGVLRAAGRRYECWRCQHRWEKKD